MSKVAVVTGGSSGIGLETVKALTNMGCTVYELSRRDIKIDGANHVSADVSDDTSVVSAISRIISEAGHIDILVNNAGFGISGAVEFTTAEDAKRLFDVNFFGSVRVTNAVLPHMRKNGGGRIVNTSSVAAIVPIPFQAFYSASKAAVNSYTMALANEVSEFGIRVSAVMPGDIKTGFTAARDKIVIGDDIYSGRIERSVSRMEKDEQSGMSPEIAGKFIASVAMNKRNKPLYTIGFGYKCISLLVKLLPASLMNEIVKLMYAK